MPKELVEISGITNFGKDQLACIQDEDGIIFIYDLKREAAVAKEKFGKRGDYEGVECVDDTCYVLRSNGNIYYFRLTKNGIGETYKFKTELSSDNNAEGLGYDLSSNRLLIACKDKPGTKKVQITNSRTVYAVQLPEKIFVQRPVFVIDAGSYNEWLEKKSLDKKKHKPFRPSAVAVHPATGDVFVIGSVGKILLILDPEGNIKNLIPLNPAIFLQPEGMCFSPAGDLFIASEGREKNGYILKF